MANLKLCVPRQMTCELCEEKSWQKVAFARPVELCKQLVVYYWKLVLNLNGAINLAVIVPIYYCIVDKWVHCTHTTHIWISMCNNFYLRNSNSDYPHRCRGRELSRFMHACDSKFALLREMYSYLIFMRQRLTLLHRLENIFANIPKRHWILYRVHDASTSFAMGFFTVDFRSNCKIANFKWCVSAKIEWY